ncbi:MAG: FadR family transcriptional regulator [Myxococcales bacterium]|nr:FadR family transcriptional regulator [Myxococcales bacterium]
MSVRTEELFELIRARIVADEFKAGDRLPPERDLAVAYGTNRNTLREAIRRLEQARLVTVRQGQGVTVADFRTRGTLDLLGPFLEHGRDIREKAELLLGLLEPRAQVVEYLVESAGKRGMPEDFDRLDAAAKALREAESKRDARAFVEAQERWLDALVVATHNLALRWVANPFLESIRGMMERALDLVVFEPSLADMAERAIALMRKGDPQAARAITEAFHRDVDEKLRRVLEPASKASVG